MNERGEIVVNGDLSADPRDVVSLNSNNWSNPIVIDKLKLVDFENIREIKKEGDSMYRETEYFRPSHPSLENLRLYRDFSKNSTSTYVREMVDMIEVQRSYEANQETVTSHDSGSR
ncbi:MAG: hypothetical protein MZW92_44140 [Comamonadaceae bacterium]|nr:hypothetical protein [Comamonadaceae bacterium]